MEQSGREGRTKMARNRRRRRSRTTTTHIHTQDYRENHSFAFAFSGKKHGLLLFYPSAIFGALETIFWGAREKEV